jgi:hypothetical protein
MELNVFHKPEQKSQGTVIKSHILILFGETLFLACYLFREPMGFELLTNISMRLKLDDSVRCTNYSFGIRVKPSVRE